MPYVYLIIEDLHPGEVVDSWTKIGATINPPEWRMDTNMAPGNCRELSVAAAFKYPTDVDAWAAEARAHRQFANVRGRQKWFRIPWQQLDQWFISDGAVRRTPADIAADNAK